MAKDVADLMRHALGRKDQTAWLLALAMVFTPFMSAAQTAQEPEPGIGVLGDADLDTDPAPLGMEQGLALCKAGQAGLQSCQETIIGGQNVGPGEAPWQVQIFRSYDLKAGQNPHQKWKDHVLCGGSYIGNNWVLTAAHCFESANFELSDYRVRLGARDLSKDEGVSFRIDQAIRHSGYNPTLKLNDIALLHFVDERLFKWDLSRYGIEPVALHGNVASGPPLTANHLFTVTGWGLTTYRDKDSFSPILQKVQLQRMPTEACAEKLETPDRINSTVLCAREPDSQMQNDRPGQESQDACQADSGGPMTIVNAQGTPVQVGIVSWGRGCGYRGFPGVYTRVAMQIEWIRSAKRLPSERRSYP
ncbi:MAG: serine protease [Hyphomonadaceae bacterium]|jgi:secreted trypsin-like serine protease